MSGRAHGTRANYVAGCRCLRCRAANANYNSTRARATAYGRPTTDLVDAGPARTHVHRAGPPPRAGGVVTAPSRLDVHHLGDGLAYVTVPGVFAAVRPACPRCPWRGARAVAAGTWRWRAWLAADIARHTCTADHQENES